MLRILYRKASKNGDINKKIGKTDDVIPKLQSMEHFKWTFVIITCDFFV